VTDPGKAVFLSYASQDAEGAAHICAALRAAGIEVWFDQSELRGGDVWDNMIRRQIKTCALFVAIISRNTHARDEGYFRLEWKLAVDRSNLMAANRAFLVPVVIDDTPEDDEQVPDKFREVQWTRLPRGETPPAFVERIRHLLSLGAASPAGAGPARPPRADAAHAGAAAAANAGLAAAANAATAAAKAATPAAAGERGAAAGASVPARSMAGRLPLVLALVAAVIAAGYFFIRQPGPPPGSTRQPDRIAAATPVATTAGNAPDKSIAVLPFTDMSEKKDQAYFSEGLTEELIDQLARVHDLHVAARTSSFYFRDKSEDIAAIAQKLHVANILEGSVRKSGNTLRISAQLIRADNGYHLWSDSYDREIKDVFKVQDDIARAVVDQLKVTLLAPIREAAAQPASSDTYNLFLQGRFAMSRDTKEGMAKAVELYKQALALDARYAPAWAALAGVYNRQIANGYLLSDPGAKLSMQASEKAISIDPSLGDAYAWLAVMQAAADHQWSLASATLARGRAVDPENSNLMFMTAQLAATTKAPDEAVALYEKALERDPLNLLIRKYRARALYFGRHFDAAEASLRQVIEQNPSFPGAHYELGRVLLAKGDAPAALATFEAEPSAAWRSFGLPLAYFAARRTDDANKALAELVRDSAGSEMQVAETYGYFGDANAAFKWLDAAVTQKDPGILWLRFNPLLGGIEKDPRYRALLRRLGLPD
jgi:TolB-like protein/Tfp pilus assembly protein PilF